MLLPYKFLYDGEEITKFEVKEATAADIADTRKAASKGKYSAIRRMAQGVLLSLNDKEEPDFLRNAIQVMPFYSLYNVIAFGMAETTGRDSVPGQYKCPKCGAVRVYEKTDDDDLEDHLSDLPQEQAEGLGCDISLIPPVEIFNADTKDVLERAENISIGWPTVTDFIKGESRYPDDDNRLMFYAYSQSLTKVNGKAVDIAYKSKFGELIFSKMKVKTINTVSDAVSKYSIGSGVERVCMQCYHRWKAPLDMAGFFDFGLQG
jgi:hypothetical protein